jgi:7-cyano-7-deazaguanine synthase
VGISALPLFIKYTVEKELHMKRVVLSVSGGMDSATLIGYYLERGYEVFPVHFQYGSKHNRYEEIAFNKLMHFYGLEAKEKTIHVAGLFEHSTSALMLHGSNIPEGHYNDDNMRQTVISGRNLVFASVLAGYAESINADIVALGVHDGDHHIYRDCRPRWIERLRSLIAYQTDDKINIEAPFLGIDKTGILNIGMNFSVVPTPYEFTRTCYKNQPFACGRCGSCVERLEAFANIGIADPVLYQEGIKEDVER